VSRFLISCGGTGGHLSPGIALAEALTQQGHNVVLLISKKNVDSKLSEKYPQLVFKAIPGTGFTLKPIGFLKCVISQTQAFLICLFLVGQNKPRAVIGFGGFTSTAIIVAARILRVRVCLHESNQVPGLALRTLGRLAQRIYLPEGIQLPQIKAHCIISTGMPVRQEIKVLDKVGSRNNFGLSSEHLLIGVLGGSQGASPLNAWARDHVQLLGRHGIQILCITGMGKGSEEIVSVITNNGDHIRSLFIPFCDKMAEFLNACDCVISRAGAGSIAELTQCEVPSILIPYPQAADNHQAKNAEVFEKKGGCVVIDQKNLKDINLNFLHSFLDRENLSKIKQKLKVLSFEKPDEIMVKDLLT
jgi:UDP-N-acetylglucosamine--N-acetylmuramyl-(pentapeptide) pyrophosphoryl-undecaprenol N-acetylglucosamine transferase